MPDRGTESLSQIGHDIIKAGSYEKLVVTAGTPTIAWQTLGQVSPEQLLTVPVVNRAAAHAMLAALWLWHDGLHEAHEIVQQSALNLHRKPWNSGQKVQLVQAVENAKDLEGHQLSEMDETLAFWHAIMHRREGDFSNAKYWYARCTNHPVLATMSPFVNDILHPLPADKSFLRLTASGWNPNAFVDLCEALHNRPADPRFPVAVMLQKLEWRLLFDHCARSASGQ